MQLEKVRESYVTKETSLFLKRPVSWLTMYLGGKQTKGVKEDRILFCDHSMWMVSSVTKVEDKLLSRLFD